MPSSGARYASQRGADGQTPPGNYWYHGRCATTTMTAARARNASMSGWRERDGAGALAIYRTKATYAHTSSTITATTSTGASQGGVERRRLLPWMRGEPVF